MTIQEQIDVMTAFRDGKDIEQRWLNGSAWHSVSDSDFDFQTFEYRIKSEPRRIFVIEHSDRLGLVHFSDAKSAESHCELRSSGRVVEFVEALK